MMHKMSNTSFFSAPIHAWVLSEGLMRPYFLPHLAQPIRLKVLTHCNLT